MHVNGDGVTLIEGLLFIFSQCRWILIGRALHWPNSKEIDGVPVTGIPVSSSTVFRMTN